MGLGLDRPLCLAPEPTLLRHGAHSPRQEPSLDTRVFPLSWAHVLRICCVHLACVCMFTCVQVCGRAVSMRLSVRVCVPVHMCVVHVCVCVHTCVCMRVVSVGACVSSTKTQCRAVTLLPCSHPPGFSHPVAGLLQLTSSCWPSPEPDVGLASVTTAARWVDTARC